MFIERGRLIIALLSAQGDTPLHFAVSYKKLEAAKLLVHRNADITAENKVRSAHTRAHVCTL
jgi:ankyrin repeat protein